MEANYATGLRINTLQPRFSCEEGKKILKEDYPVQDTSSAFYRKRKIPIYGNEVFLDVGRAFLVSILDLHGINPLSRLVKAAGAEEASAVLVKLRKDLKREYQKPSIKSLKKGKKGKKKNMEGPTFELCLGGPAP